MWNPERVLWKMELSEWKMELSEHARDIRSLLFEFEQPCHFQRRTLKSHTKYKRLPSKFSIDLMPNTFGCSSESWGQFHRDAVSSSNRKGLALEDGSYSGMRLRCNQLSEHFSFQDRRLAVRPLPLRIRKNRRGFDEICC
jgi:hypothetical protein